MWISGGRSLSTLNTSALPDMSKNKGKMQIKCYYRSLGGVQVFNFEQQLSATEHSNSSAFHIAVLHSSISE